MRQHTFNGTAEHQQLLLQVVFPEDPQEKESLLWCLDYHRDVGSTGEIFSDVFTQKPENRNHFLMVLIDLGSSSVILMTTKLPVRTPLSATVSLNKTMNP